MHAHIIQDNGNISKLTQTKKSKHSEWTGTQWHEAKSGRPNLWAAQM